MVSFWRLTRQTDSFSSWTSSARGILSGCRYKRQSNLLQRITLIRLMSDSVWLRLATHSRSCTRYLHHVARRWVSPCGSDRIVPDRITSHWIDSARGASFGPSSQVAHSQPEAEANRNPFISGKFVGGMNPSCCQWKIVCRWSSA